MNMLEVEISGTGELRIASGISLPPQARLAVLLLGPAADPARKQRDATIVSLAEQSGAFDFLSDEPEIYSDDDILPGRENPRFRK